MASVSSENLHLEPCVHSGCWPRSGIMNLVLPHLIGSFLDANSEVAISKLAIVFAATVRGPPMACVVKSPATFRARHGG
eukprot:9474525-Pyramimonas_sp.AAC.1